MGDARDRAVLAVDAALRDAVAIAADDHLDMTAALAGAQAIQGSLALAFERRLLSLLGRKEGPGAEMKPLITEIARLQSEVFVMRAALAGHGNAQPHYRDPLLALRELLNGEASLTPRPPFRTVAGLGPEVLGYGWHPPERQGQGPWFRWSGPGERSGLLVPTGGAGRHHLTIRLRSPLPDLLAGMTITVNGCAWLPAQAEEAGQIILRGAFDAAAEGAQRFFALLEWSLAETRPLAEFGGTDPRRAGFALLEVLVEQNDAEG